MSKVKAKQLKKTETEENVLELSQQRISKMFDRFDNVNVSFSGGKDSTVLLELVVAEAAKRNRLPLDVTFWDEEAIAPESVDFIRRTYHREDINMAWYCVPIENRNACSKSHPKWYTWDPACKDLWVRPLPPEATTEIPNFVYKLHNHHNIQGLLYPLDKGTVAHTMGIRASESLRRHLSVSNHEYDNWISRYKSGEKAKKWKDGKVVGGLYGFYCPDAPHVAVCKPIYDWSTQDVWTAHQKFEWDYNRVYDLLEAFGLSRHGARLSAAFPEEALNNLSQWPELWPELWEKMLKRVPGVATAGRYSRSPLYTPDGDLKPSGMSWKEAIAAEIEKFPLTEQTLISDRIKRLITTFKEMYPGERIPEVIVGNYQLSWKFLYLIAKRGDFRGRMGVIYSDKSPTPDAAYLKKRGRS